MHADFQELLALRDGAPVGAEVGQHVAGCAQCGSELARLKRLKHELHQLPSFEPQEHAWPLIRERLERLPRRRRVTPWAFAPAAVAAGLVATLTLLWWIRLDHGHAGSDDATIQSLVSRSQRLEAVLNTLPPRPTVERAATSAAIDELQTRIQILDQQLSAAANGDRYQTQRLWSARVQLMNSLVYVRYAEAARNGDRPDHSPTFGAI
jgi:hypothetical protein